MQKTTWLIIGLNLMAGFTATGAETQEIKSTTSGTVPATTHYPPLIVTATKIPESPTNVPSSFTLFQREQWQAEQKHQVVDVLHNSPGVFLSKAGGVGKTTSVFIRGSSSEHTLVMLDGIRLNPVFDRRFEFLGLSLDNLDRIEVIRGPQSALYGSEALGGVINLITRRYVEEPETTITLEAGSFNTFRESLSTIGMLDQTLYSLEATRLDTSNERSNNDFEGTTGRFRIIHPIDEVTEAGFLYSGDYLEGQDPLDDTQDDPDDYYRMIRHLIATDWSRQMTEIYTTKLVLGYDYEERVNFNSTVSPFPFLSRPIVQAHRVQYDWQNNIQLPADNLLTAGLMGSTASLHREDPFQGQETRQKSFTENALYLQDTWQMMENWLLVGGIRYNEFDEFDPEFTYRIGSSYFVDCSSSKLHASFGTGFRAPSINELYVDYAPFFFSNPDLEPEKSRGFDVGITQYFDILHRKGHVDITYFHNRIEDIIVGTFDPSTFTGTLINENAARTQGVEISMEYEVLTNLNLRANYTCLDTDLDNELGSTERLLRRPRHSASAGLDYAIDPKWHLGFAWLYVGTRPDIDPVTFNSNSENEEYWTMDLYTSYQVTDELQIFARVENLFDEQYDQILGYPARGRGFFGGVRYRF